MRHFRNKKIGYMMLSWFITVICLLFTALVFTINNATVDIILLLGNIACLVGIIYCCKKGDLF